MICCRRISVLRVVHFLLLICNKSAGHLLRIGFLAAIQVPLVCITVETMTIGKGTDVYLVRFSLIS